ncbi:Glycosyl transferase [Sphingopyxis sp. LC81]|uniref:glycosyltransferase family 4 protein n=1 Tax=Sphingopyxis sp. LC81 TaxID=1502850 RepID=UPI00050FE45F|nr:glycosyltransferase family 4 protein [Sphingopyxis sp. LC81]KGB54085.1 Glycosyl transferase [Sphingopyxis sp. LC81]
MHILYVTQWFQPEPAFKGIDFATALAASGHEVEVATGFPNYPGGKLYTGHKIRPYRQETMDGIKVHRLFLYPSHDQSSVGRALNYLSFFLSVLIFGLLRGRRYDAIYVYHPPITPGLAVALFTRLYRQRFIIEIQDLWPDSVGASGMANGRVMRVLGWLCNFVYRKADHIVPQSDGMRARLIERGVPEAKLSRIYNWATYVPAAENSSPEIPAGFAGHLNIVYGGNLGQAQSLDSLIDALDIARRAAPSLRLHLFGDGIEREHLARRAADRSDGDLILHGPVSRDRMDRIFDAADILAVHLKDDPLYTITIPSKTQHYLACGKPIIAGLAGEAAGILLRSGGAIVCAPDDVAAMAAGLERLAAMSSEGRQAMGRRARACYDEFFDMDRAVEKTLQLIAGQS